MEHRFARHHVLPEVGPEGQARLGNGRVLVVGCGALGTHTAEALLRAGVGHLILVDRDIVEVHNLHRVSLFTPAELGQPKAWAAADKLRAIAPHAVVEPLVAHFDGELAEEWVPKVDAVVDGLDNMETRYLLNDACVKHRIPYVYTAVLATYGMTMPIVPEKGPCLRCVFPQPPAPGELPTCAQAGILGPVPKALAAVQAATAIQILTASPDLRPGELFYLDLWTKRTQVVEMQRSRSCPSCGHRDFEFLRQQPGTALLCGDVVQVRPRRRGELDLAGLAQRLAPLGKVRLSHGLLFFEAGEARFVVFPDGRALVHGVNSPERAQSLYDQYIA